MRAVDIIIRKRDGLALSREEIDFFVEGYASGTIPDYQAAAWAMAVLLKGMTPEETTHLTLAMAASGDTLDLSEVVDIAVDKHSTGGVGDKTTLVVEPVVAACGLAVGKMSGRGLGFSGGTLDKMESIPGFRTDLTTQEFLDRLKNSGLVLTGQTGELAPADGQLYALRDVTGTVPSIPLIASSVMSKKIAAGAQAIVLDVKVGLGAFMQTLAEAAELARLMVEIGKLAGRRTVALISDMNQPLGHAVGNALEVKEAIATLHGAGPADFEAHCIEVAAQMLLLGGKAADDPAARDLAKQALEDRSGWAAFKQMVSGQGGDVTFVEQPERLPKARLIETVAAPRGGFLSQVHARIIGETAVLLGAGRAKKGDPIDHAVGIEVHGKVGDRFQAGAPLFTLHANSTDSLAQAQELVLSSCQWNDEPVEPLPIIYELIRDE